MKIKLALMIFPVLAVCSALQAEDEVWSLFEGNLDSPGSIQLLSFDDAAVNQFLENEPQSNIEKSNQEIADLFLNDTVPQQFRLSDYIVRGQSPGGSGGGAGAATDPSVPLMQLQIQNVSIPSSYAADRYSNQLIVQPVIPLFLDSDFIPYHIIRPTLPIVSPTPNPDGPLGIQGGLADLALLDVYVHPIEELKTNVGVGYIAILPTSGDPQLGLGEWQLGPSVFVITKAVPKWNLGILMEAPFSVESDAYAIQGQPIAVRLLPDEWYVGWGDLNWKFDDQNGNYDLPINLRVGKVTECGGHKLNIFLQPQYTPRGFHSGQTAEWGIKLSVTFLFPEAHWHDPFHG